MSKENLSMKSWADDEKPREKMLQKGVAALSLSELFAILLRSGVDGESALQLARRIMIDNKNDLDELARRNIRELMSKYKGVGVAKAASIIAAMEIGRRRQQRVALESPVVCCSKDAYDYFRSLMVDLEHEEFWVIYLSGGNRIRGCECISSGGMDATIVDVRILFRNALEVKAVSIIVAHNHPGGSVRPSAHDEAITRKICEAGQLLDIKLFDHVIVGCSNYYSFADEGLLQRLTRKQ